MNYFEFEISITPNSLQITEIIIAELSEAGFESFSESETTLLAYIPEKSVSIEIINSILSEKRLENYSIRYRSKLIPAQNWNAIWESNFEPIIIKDNILVRAPFHLPNPKFKYEIVIEPKMSFGTGHHETTSLMLEQMLEIDLTGKTVLDMGCGTGILAIFAAQKNAKEVTAIDFDESAFENSKENIIRNNCKEIEVLIGETSSIPKKNYDIILANINRNVLLNDIKIYTKHLQTDNLLILSGFYSEDISGIEAEANINKLFMQKFNLKNNWAVCIFKKH